MGIVAHTEHILVSGTGTEFVVHLTGILGGILRPYPTRRYGSSEYYGRI